MSAVKDSLAVKVFCATVLLAISGIGGEALSAQDKGKIPTDAAEQLDPGEDSEELQVDTYVQSVRFTSPPAQGMTFTQGIPIRAFASCYYPGSKVECFADGKSWGSLALRDDLKDYFEFFVKDLPTGRHILSLKATFSTGSPAESPPLAVIVEDAPPRANTIKLTQDLVLKTGQELKWENATIIGGGFRVCSDHCGSVTIKNCRISGLGSESAPGIEIHAGGNATIEDNVFESSGIIRIGTEGKGDFVVRNNEFRANNLIKFIPSEPGYSPMLVLSGNPSGKKVFQGNRVGIGWAEIQGGSEWLIGGEDDDTCNILLGQRGGLHMWGCADAMVRGNYSSQKCGSGWSQPVNFYFENCKGMLCEHNLIGESSWPLEHFGQASASEFRFNVFSGAGHQWVRMLNSGDKLHHNLFLNGCSRYTGGILFWDKIKDVAVYNNTFDGGATRRTHNTTLPVLWADGPGNSFGSIRNNIFTGNVPMDNGTLAPIVLTAPGCVTYADYNCVFNPQATKAIAYAPGSVSGNAGGHDIHSDPRFPAGVPTSPPVKLGQMWNHKAKLSQVLSYYRARYAPVAGSPVLGAGDPADGKNSYIGAIGPNNDPGDRLGRFGAANDKNVKTAGK